MQRPILGKYDLRRGNATKRKKAFANHRRTEMSRYTACNRMMKKFLEGPSKKSWQKFKHAYEELSKENPSQANAVMAYVRKQMFDRTLKEEDFK